MSTILPNVGQMCPSSYVKHSVEVFRFVAHWLTMGLYKTLRISRWRSFIVFNNALIYSTILSLSKRCVQLSSFQVWGCVLKTSSFSFEKDLFVFISLPSSNRKYVLSMVWPYFYQALIVFLINTIIYLLCRLSLLIFLSILIRLV